MLSKVQRVSEDVAELIEFLAHAEARQAQFLDLAKTASATSYKLWDPKNIEQNDALLQEVLWASTQCQDYAQEAETYKTRLGLRRNTLNTLQTKRQEWTSLRGSLPRTRNSSQIKFIKRPLPELVWCSDTNSYQRASKSSQQLPGLKRQTSSPQFPVDSIPNAQVKRARLDAASLPASTRPDVTHARVGSYATPPSTPLLSFLPEAMSAVEKMRPRSDIVSLHAGTGSDIPHARVGFCATPSSPPLSSFPTAAMPATEEMHVMPGTASLLAGTWPDVAHARVESCATPLSLLPSSLPAETMPAAEETRLKSVTASLPAGTCPDVTHARSRSCATPPFPPPSCFPPEAMPAVEKMLARSDIEPLPAGTGSDIPHARVGSCATPSSPPLSSLTTAAMPATEEMRVMPDTASLLVGTWLDVAHARVGSCATPPSLLPSSFPAEIMSTAKETRLKLVTASLPAGTCPDVTHARSRSCATPPSPPPSSFPPEAMPTVEKMRAGSDIAGMGPEIPHARAGSCATPPCPPLSSFPAKAMPAAEETRVMRATASLPAGTWPDVAHARAGSCAMLPFPPAVPTHDVAAPTPFQIVSNKQHARCVSKYPVITSAMLSYCQLQMKPTQRFSTDDTSSALFLILEVHGTKEQQLNLPKRNWRMDSRAEQLAVAPKLALDFLLRNIPGLRELFKNMNSTDQRSSRESVQVFFPDGTKGGVPSDSNVIIQLCLPRSETRNSLVDGSLPIPSSLMVLPVHDSYVQVTLDRESSTLLQTVAEACGSRRSDPILMANTITQVIAQQHGAGLGIRAHLSSNPSHVVLTCPFTEQCNLHTNTLDVFGLPLRTLPPHEDEKKHLGRLFLALPSASTDNLSHKVMVGPLVPHGGARGAESLVMKAKLQEALPSVEIHSLAAPGAASHALLLCCENATHADETITALGTSSLRNIMSAFWCGPLTLIDKVVGPVELLRQGRRSEVQTWAMNRGKQVPQSWNRDRTERCGTSGPAPVPADTKPDIARERAEPHVSLPSPPYLPASSLSQAAEAKPAAEEVRVRSGPASLPAVTEFDLSHVRVGTGAALLSPPLPARPADTMPAGEDLQVRSDPAPPAVCKKPPHAAHARSGPDAASSPHHLSFPAETVPVAEDVRVKSGTASESLSRSAGTKPDTTQVRTTDATLPWPPPPQPMPDHARVGPGADPAPHPLLSCPVDTVPVGQALMDTAYMEMDTDPSGQTLRVINTECLAMDTEPSGQTICDAAYARAGPCATPMPSPLSSLHAGAMPAAEGMSVRSGTASLLSVSRPDVTHARVGPCAMSPFPPQQSFPGQAKPIAEVMRVTLGTTASLLTGTGHSVAQARAGFCATSPSPPPSSFPLEVMPDVMNMRARSGVVAQARARSWATPSSPPLSAFLTKAMPAAEEMRARSGTASPIAGTRPNVTHARAGSCATPLSPLLSSFPPEAMPVTEEMQVMPGTVSLHAGTWPDVAQARAGSCATQSSPPPSSVPAEVMPAAREVLQRADPASLHVGISKLCASHINDTLEQIKPGSHRCANCGRHLSACLSDSDCTRYSYAAQATTDTPFDFTPFSASSPLPQVPAVELNTAHGPARHEHSSSRKTSKGSANRPRLRPPHT